MGVDVFKDEPRTNFLLFDEKSDIARLIFAVDFLAPNLTTTSPSHGHNKRQYHTSPVQKAKSRNLMRVVKIFQNLTLM